MKMEFNIDPWLASPSMLQKHYKYYEVPAEDTWRLPLLTSLMKEIQEMDACGECTETISGLIDSLCYS